MYKQVFKRKSTRGVLFLILCITKLQADFLGIGHAFESAYDSTKSAAQSGWDATKGAAQSGWNATKSGVTSAYNKTVDFASPAVQQAQNAIHTLEQGIKVGIAKGQCPNVLVHCYS